jgi:ribosomal protein L2
MEAKNPLPKSSVEGKHSKMKSQESYILSGTPYKKFLEGKEKEKASEMKGKAERRLKSWKQDRKMSGSLK